MDGLQARNQVLWIVDFGGIYLGMGSVSIAFVGFWMACKAPIASVFCLFVLRI